MMAHGLSERRARKLVALDRSTFQYRKKLDTDAALRPAAHCDRRALLVRLPALGRRVAT